MVGFTFSDDAVEFLLDLTGNPVLADRERQWLVLLADLTLVLLTMTIELNHLRRNAREGDPGTRVAPGFTVLLICTALALAFSVLVKADSAPCGPGAVWHEYIAFVVSVQALAIGLSTLIWLYLANAGDTTHEEA